ncbi:hypothetical protein [Geobacillus sp. TFV-3]|uniref:hypothetical protein n=1 Tax=Geobacillus sp. TFV-3 TaxID=1897059 RepID=UPI00135BFD76|nr:hypothetical protein [Geobacillus sp. TFV-3]KAF0994218.1 hypothetical protein BJQ97_00860 [Geobacillus sp. TFV-3]
MKKMAMSIVTIGVIFIGGVVYFIKDGGNTDKQIGSADVTKQTHTFSHSDRPKYTNIKDLGKASDCIFVGTVEGVAGTRNLARNPNDPVEEAPNIYVEGVDYNVKVIEVLKGKADSHVLVTEQKQTKLGKDEPMVVDEHYIGLTSGQTYIFFVKKSNLTGRYYSVGDPFFFALENNQVVLKTKEKDLLEIYKPEEVKAFKARVKEAVEE